MLVVMTSLLKQPDFPYDSNTPSLVKTNILECYASYANIYSAVTGVFKDQVVLV